MTTTEEKQCPLARDINGDPVEVPGEAVAWRVRRRSGKQGRPQSVFDPETGTPLEIELDCGIDELRPFGSGGYRLDGIDGSGKLIPGVTAYVEVPTDEAVPPPPCDAPTETAAALREMTQLLRESMQTNCRALEALASAFGPVRPSAAHPMPVPSAPTAPTSDEKSADMMTKIFEALPHVAQMLPMMIDVFKTAVAGASSAAAAASGTPTVPTA